MAKDLMSGGMVIDSIFYIRGFPNGKVSFLCAPAISGFDSPRPIQATIKATPATIAQKYLTMSISLTSSIDHDETYRGKRLLTFARIPPRAGPTMYAAFMKPSKRARYLLRSSDGIKSATTLMTQQTNE